MSVEKIEANYQGAKADFQKTKCKTCRNTELGHSWDIDVASMAAKVGELFPDLLLAAYIVPTLEPMIWITKQRNCPSVPNACTNMGWQFVDTKRLQRRD